MKNVAKCDKWWKLQNTSTHRIFECILHPGFVLGSTYLSSVFLTKYKESLRLYLAVVESSAKTKKKRRGYWGLIFLESKVWGVLERTFFGFNSGEVIPLNVK